MKNKLGKITALFLFISGIVGKAFACGMCGESMLRYAVPNIYYIILTMLIWRLLYGILQYKVSKPGLLKTTISVIIIVFVLGFFTLLFSSIVLIIYLLSSIFINAKKDHAHFKTDSTLAYKKQVLFLYRALVVIIIFLIITGAIEKSRLDEFDRMKKYTLFGTGPEGRLIEKIAAENDFDLNRLRPMLGNEELNCFDRACNLLRHRANPADLVFLKNEILSIEQLTECIDEKEYDSFYLKDWLREIGAGDIKSKEELKKWIEEKEKELEKE